MQLRNARLCLDCEEIHTHQQCPVCASESFAYLTRWVPADDRRQNRRTTPVSNLAKTPSTNNMRWVKRGAAGVAVVAASRWLWNMSRPVEWAEWDQGRASSRFDRETMPTD